MIVIIRIDIRPEESELDIKVDFDLFAVKGLVSIYQHNTNDDPYMPLFQLPSHLQLAHLPSQAFLNLASATLSRLFPARTARRGGGEYGLVALVGLEILDHHRKPSSASVPAAAAMDLCRRANPFLFCSCLRVLGYLMVALVAALAVLTYQAVVVIAWGPPLLRFSPLAFPIVITFHLLLVLSAWSYFMVVSHDPGSVPPNWRPNFDEERLEIGSSIPWTDYAAPETRVSARLSLEGSERTNIGYCNRCQNGKPPRCHHCSICQRCVLKMDHHCVWVVNCVGARNYKYFLLFLFYTFLATVLATFALLPHFIKFFGDAKNHSGSGANLAITFVAFVLNLAFALSLLCFVVMHISILLRNTTTIEALEKKNAVVWKYDLGKRKNFEQVFGTKKLLWFFPLYSREDVANIPALQGLDFPICPNAES